MSTYRQPKVITVCGQTCSGKTTLATHMTSSRLFREAVSVTTRPRRSQEVEGEDYFFATPVAFGEMQARDEFIEVNKFGSNYYGSLKSQFRSIAVDGVSVVVVIEPYGALNIRRFCKEAGLDVVSAYVKCHPNTALERLAERFLRDSSRDMHAADIYAERFLKMMLMEPHWLASMRYDLVFDASVNHTDLVAMQDALDTSPGSRLATNPIPLSVESAMQYAESREIPGRTEAVVDYLRGSLDRSASCIAGDILKLLTPTNSMERSAGASLAK